MSLRKWLLLVKGFFSRLTVWKAIVKTKEISIKRLAMKTM